MSTDDGFFSCLSRLRRRRIDNCKKVLKLTRIFLSFAAHLFYLFDEGLSATVLVRVSKDDARLCQAELLYLVEVWDGERTVGTIGQGEPLSDQEELVHEELVDAVWAEVDFLKD